MSRVIAPLPSKLGIKPRVLWLLCAMLLLVFFCSAYTLWRAQQFNGAMQRGEVERAKAFAPMPRRQMLHALAHEQSDQLQRASEGYAALVSSGEGALWSVSRFNLAGVYLRQAVALELAEKQDGRAVLIELAKLHYRALLQARPSDESAAYNLALALALQPDVIASGPADLDNMPERSPQAPVTAAGRERLP